MSDDQLPPQPETLAEIERLCTLLEPIDVRAKVLRSASRIAREESTARGILQVTRSLLAEQGIKE